MISLVGSGLWHRDLHAQRDLFLYICKTFNKLLNYSLHFMLVMPCNRYKNQSFASNFCVFSWKSFTAFWRQGFLLQSPYDYQTPDYRSVPINGLLLFCIQKGRIETFWIGNYFCLNWIEFESINLMWDSQLPMATFWTFWSGIHMPFK